MVIFLGKESLFKIFIGSVFISIFAAFFHNLAYNKMQFPIYFKLQITAPLLIKKEFKELSEYLSQGQLEIIKLTHLNSNRFEMILRDFGKRGDDEILKYIKDNMEIYLYLPELKQIKQRLVASTWFLNDNFDSYQEYLVFTKNLENLNRNPYIEIPWAEIKNKSKFIELIHAKTANLMQDLPPLGEQVQTIDIHQLPFDYWQFLIKFFIFFMITMSSAVFLWELCLYDLKKYSI